MQAEHDRLLEDRFTVAAIKACENLPDEQRLGFIAGLRHAAKEHDDMRNFLSGYGTYRELAGVVERDNKRAAAHGDHGTYFPTFRRHSTLHQPLIRR